MKLAGERPTTQSARIYALEQSRKSDGERLDKIETMVAEIHGLLVKARGFKWVMDGVFKYAGQLSIACGAAYGAWKFFTGH